MNQIISLIKNAIQARLQSNLQGSTSALRLFNGFLEGYADLQIDSFTDTILLTNYARDPSHLEALLPKLQTVLLEIFPGLHCLLLKDRSVSQPQGRFSRILFGNEPSKWILENNVKYGLDLNLNQDSSFYLDTRNLRFWLINNAKGWRVLNTFAYTGSLGIACIAGGASQVIQTDRNSRFLKLAETSCELNGFPKQRQIFRTGDFFPITSQFRQAKESFDCVLVDPPFFSTSSKGTINIQTQYRKILNKVRPLVRDNGYLIAINNALYQSGRDYVKVLQEIGAEGFVILEKIITVPEDVTGYIDTIKNSLPTDPAPFNYSTKIAILRIKRK